MSKTPKNDGSGRLCVYTYFFFLLLFFPPTQHTYNTGVYVYLLSFWLYERKYLHLFVFISRNYLIKLTYELIN